MLKVCPPVDVVFTAAVIAVSVVATVVCLACPAHFPTFPTLSTAASSTFCEQQEALYVATVTLAPPAPATVLVLRVPFPLRMVMLSIPVPLMPSVRFAMNVHCEEAHSDEEDGQLEEELTVWHTGRVISVTWETNSGRDGKIMQQNWHFINH